MFSTANEESFYHCTFRVDSNVLYLQMYSSATWLGLKIIPEFAIAGDHKKAKLSQNLCAKKVTQAGPLKQDH